MHSLTACPFGRSGGYTAAIRIISTLLLFDIHYIVFLYILKLPITNNIPIIIAPILKISISKSFSGLNLHVKKARIKYHLKIPEEINTTPRISKTIFNNIITLHTLNSKYNFYILKRFHCVFFRILLNMTQYN